MRIAIVGPDGAGKTSVANYLKSALPQAKLVYAGKSHNHSLLTTVWSYHLWQSVAKWRFTFATQFVRFFVFYPLEFIENLVRFRRLNDGKIVIYDRHPVDRMVMVFEYKQRMECYGLWCGLSQYPLLLLLNFWYHNFFPTIDRLYFLLPESQLCFQRADGHYKRVEEAGWKVNAYRRAATQLAARQPLHIIEITPSLTVAEIGNRILQELQL